MEVLIINQEDVPALLPMHERIRVMEQALAALARSDARPLALDHVVA